jgi:ubiquinone/menaquinone biosynthesis C-methylase UbiE
MSGVNISEHEIDVAKKNAHQTNCHIDFQVGDLSGKTPFADASFDQIISLDTVVHISDIPAVFREFHRLLKPNGRLVLSLASFAPSGRGGLFWGENLLRKFTPRFLYAPATYQGKSWLTLSADEQQKRFYQHVVFTPATLETQIRELFVLSHQEYAIHLFTSLATDLIFGLRFVKYIEPLIFVLAARLDHLFFSKHRPGYLMFVTLQKI